MTDEEKLAEVLRSVRELRVAVDGLLAEYRELVAALKLTTAVTEMVYTPEAREATLAAKAILAKVRT